MPQKILIIEDETLLLKAYRTVLEDEGFAVLTASTLLEALSVFEAHPDISLIAVDGCFPRAQGENPDPEQGMPCSGEKFILNVDFDGPIIACSSVSGYNQKMINVGATKVSRKGRPLCQMIRECLLAPPAVES